MTESSGISRKELFARVGGFKQKKWLSVGKKLGLEIRKDFGKGSHALMLNHNFPENDQKHFVTVQKKTHKIINQEICKNLLNMGFEPDEIAKAL